MHDCQFLPHALNFNVVNVVHCLERRLQQSLSTIFPGGLSLLMGGALWKHVSKLASDTLETSILNSKLLANLKPLLFKNAPA